MVGKKPLESRFSLSGSFSSAFFFVNMHVESTTLSVNESRNKSINARELPEVSGLIKTNLKVSIRFLN